VQNAGASRVNIYYRREFKDFFCERLVRLAQRLHIGVALKVQIHEPEVLAAADGQQLVLERDQLGGAVKLALQQLRVNLVVSALKAEGRDAQLELENLELKALDEVGRADGGGRAGRHMKGIYQWFPVGDFFIHF